MDITLDGSRRGAQNAPALPAARLSAGLKLNDRYEVEQLIDRLAYGEVYRACDLSSGQPVALTALTAELLEGEGLVDKLRLELELATALEQKNIATAHGLGQAEVGGDRVTYLVRELVEGQRLRDMIQRKSSSGRPFSIKGAYNVVAHLCNGLTYAHGAMVHGALTSDVVMVNSAGRIKMLDFGVARTLYGALLRRGAPRPATLPPEFGSGDEADPRSDLYSVGALLFELLTGRPYKAGDHIPDVPAAINTLVGTCLLQSPEGRPASAQAVKELLQQAVAAEFGHSPSLVAPGPSRIARPPALSSRPGVTPPPPPPSIAAAAATEESAERWLIQKDKLDFGPFSMRQVRAQIESFAILGEHTIVDTETKVRCAVKDHPALRQLVLRAEAQRQVQVKEAQETSERRVHRNRITLLLGGLVLLVAAAGGGTFWYYQHHQRVVVQREVVRDDSFDFLKGMEISMKVDPAPPKKPKPSGAAHRGGKNNKGEFSDVTNLGDANSEGGDEVLDQSVVQQVMTQNFKLLVGCIGEERRRNGGLRRVDMDFVIRGAGNVTAVKANGSTSSPFASCLFSKMQTITFPKFNGSKTSASFSLNLK